MKRDDLLMVDGVALQTAIEIKIVFWRIIVKAKTWCKRLLRNNV